MNQRPRRNRKTAQIRDFHAETELSAKNLVYPIFVREGKGTDPISSMPGISRFGELSVMEEVARAVDLGIDSFIFFPAIEEKKKDKMGSESHNSSGLVPRVLQTFKEKYPCKVVLSDVALDPYNIDGHDGVMSERGEILNDETVSILCQQALCHAKAGVDFVAPSDMMDGRIGEIREALDSEGFTGTGILSYCAKYASSFYGPFREALDSAPKSGDKKTYQMDPRNRREALRELLLDEEEGADILMVKPAGAYLDVISMFRESTALPIAAYQVSGEYAMLKAASEKGWLDEKATVLESLTAIRRAGASWIFTYFAPQAAKWMAK